MQRSQPEVSRAELELLERMREIYKVEPAPPPPAWRPVGVLDTELAILVGNQSSFTPEILFRRLQYWCARFEEREKAFETLQDQVTEREEEFSNAQYAREIHEEEKFQWQQERRVYDDKIADLERWVTVAESSVQEKEDRLTEQREDMLQQVASHENDKDYLLQALDQPVGGDESQSTIVQKFNAMRIQRDEATKAKIEFGNRMTVMFAENEELTKRIEQLQTELQAKPNEAAFLERYGIVSPEDLNRQFVELRGDIDKAWDDADESARRLASATQAQKEHNQNWTTLLTNFISGDVNMKDIAPLLDQFDLSRPLELRGAAGNSESFLASEYFSQTDNDLRDAGLALRQPSTITDMLTVALRRRPFLPDSIDDMLQVQAGLRAIEQSLDVEPTRTEQELFIKVVLIWLHNILDNETSGLRLGMAIGLLTGILDMIDPTLTFLQSFCSQLEDQLSKGLLPMAMSLRCMHRMQYTPHFWSMPAAFKLPEDFDFGRSITQIAKDLYQNNETSFLGDFVFLSESFGGGTYTSMTLLYDDPRHHEVILFERADHSVTFWTGKWLFTFDLGKTAWEARLDPALPVEVVLSFTREGPLGRWMADYHGSEVFHAWDVASRRA